MNIFFLESTVFFMIFVFDSFCFFLPFLYLSLADLCYSCGFGGF